MSLTRRDALGLALLCGLLAAVVFVPAERALPAIERAADAPWFLVALLGLYLVRPFLGWPHTPFPIAVGVLYGLVPGVAIALVGAVLTCLPAYVAGRWFDVEHGLFGRLSRLGDRVVAVTGTTRGIAGARLTPVPTDLVSYAAGVAGVPLRPYLVGTFLGEIPWILVLVTLGASVGTLTLDPETVPAAPVWLVIAFALVGLALLAWPVVADRIRQGA